MSAIDEAKIPAPERDLDNVDPAVPPASTETSPVSRAIFGSIAIAFGISFVIIAVAAAVFQVSPLPQDFFNGDEVTAALMAGLSGLSLVGCGLLIFRRSTAGTALLLILSLVFGYAASVIG